MCDIQRKADAEKERGKERMQCRETVWVRKRGSEKRMINRERDRERDTRERDRERK